jgi:hypothetical protein
MTNVIFIFLPIFGSIAVVWVLSRIIVSPADESRKAQYIGNGQLEFAPNKRNYVAVVLFVAYLLYMSVSLIFTSLSTVAGQIGAAFWLAIALILVASFPASILLTGEGLQQVYWLRKKRIIVWKDVSEIAIDEKRNRVTIKGNGGAKIVYTRQLPDKTRLMAELEKYCGDKMPAEARQNVLVSS